MNQVIAEKAIDGIVVRLPAVRAPRLSELIPFRCCCTHSLIASEHPRACDELLPLRPGFAQATRNMAVDGYKPKPH